MSRRLTLLPSHVMVASAEVKRDAGEGEAEKSVWKEMVDTVHMSQQGAPKLQHLKTMMSYKTLKVHKTFNSG